MPIIAAAAAESGVWEAVFQLFALLAAALVIGMLFERFGQSAILGYLIAGMVLGPQVLGVVSKDSGVPVIAELGVSLLLFTIGLEFSARRLLRLGPVAGLGGSLQVVATLFLSTGLAMLFGQDLKAALCIGSAVALSSTACVLRLLTDRSEIDSVHGRTALGILLLQDIAVVPLVLFVTMLAGGGGPSEMILGLGKAVGLIVAMVAGFRILAGWVIPSVMKQLSLSRDRELLVLLAVVLATGSALAAHALELSPALGAFIAGMMLAESPFSTQIRADVGGLRILFVTLFFASVGMLGDPVWIAGNFPAVIGLTVLIIAGKGLVVALVARAFRLPARYALATGLALAQVGEFGVVIAGIAKSGGVLEDEPFRLLVSATLLALFATPLLVRIARPAGRKLEDWLMRSRKAATDREAVTNPSADSRLVFIIGFGPAGQRVATDLDQMENLSCLVIDLRPANIDLAKSMGLHAVLGDATHLEFLIHHGIEQADAAIITVPDHRTVVRLVGSIRQLGDDIAIVARARYHAFTDEVIEAGATVTVDEEQVTGRRLIAATREVLRQRTRRKIS
ncbi:MAG: cation:proton antiporter [Verrucomicrobiales bacterium]|nr:cation:proton antiporter [Verrucomicrobiales bacterium]